jgi:seryl-tRNA synthetase
MDNRPNMLLEDVPVGMSEQGNKLIKHYTFDNERVVMFFI